MNKSKNKLSDKARYTFGIISSIITLILLVFMSAYFLWQYTALHLIRLLLFGILTFICALADVLCIFYIYRPLLLLLKVHELLNYSDDEIDMLEKFQNMFLFKTVKDISDIRYQALSKKQESALAKKNVEFSVLQNQINPHFLYNTLESIRSEAIEQDAYEIAKMVKVLSSFYRYSIDAHNHVVTFKDELQNLQNYFTIQRFRFGDKISLIIDVEPEDARCYNFSMLKMTLQPIAENAIFHGLEAKSGKGELTIAVTLTDSLFIITISDNGVGIQSDKLKELNKMLSNTSSSKENEYSTFYVETNKTHGTGTALLNVNKRIKLFFGEQYGLIVRSIPGIGTDIEMSLPIEAFKNI